MSSFEQNIENILAKLQNHLTGNPGIAYSPAEAKAALIQAHQDDLIAVIGEDEPDPGLTLAIGGISNQPQRERLWTRNDLRAEQRTHLTQETGND